MVLFTLLSTFAAFQGMQLTALKDFFVLESCLKILKSITSYTYRIQIVSFWRTTFIWIQIYQGPYCILKLFILSNYPINIWIIIHEFYWLELGAIPLRLEFSLCDLFGWIFNVIIVCNSLNIYPGFRITGTHYTQHKGFTASILLKFVKHYRLLAGTKFTIDPLSMFYVGHYSRYIWHWT